MLDFAHAGLVSDESSMSLGPSPHTTRVAGIDLNTTRGVRNARAMVLVSLAVLPSGLVIPGQIEHARVVTTCGDSGESTWCTSRAVPSGTSFPDVAQGHLLSMFDERKWGCRYFSFRCCSGAGPHGGRMGDQEGPGFHDGSGPGGAGPHVLCVILGA
jgi:hypothetical protein